jgi:ubiquinone/menaquinone biosynthesis C-methylase UbiE
MLVMKIIGFLARLCKNAGARLEGLTQNSDEHRRFVIKAGSAHDMTKHPDEPYYAAQYLHWIRKHLPEGLVGIDLGCGQGRLTLLLSPFCQHITGVDFNPNAVSLAQEYAAQANCLNTHFVQGDVARYVQDIPSASMDFLVLTEVILFLPNFKEVLNEIYRALKPGGKVFISFRSQMHNILDSIRRKQWDSATMAVSQREGYLWGGATWFSWQTKEEVQNLLSQAHFSVLECVGIGVCSGIEGDPLAAIARPSLLDAEGQKRMMEIELELASSYVNQGRYILAVARK